MTSKIIHKRSAVPGQGPNDLEYGELAINYADGDLYYKDAENNIQVFVNKLQIETIIDSASQVDNVLYVAKNGSDSNDGTTLAKPFLTIKAALAVATQGTTVFVKSGSYAEDNPVTIPQRVAIVGDNLRTTSIIPLNPTSDIFYVNNAVYVTGVTFREHVFPAAAIAYNPNGSAGFITTSPYIQNCSSITTTGAGMRVDGAHVTGLRSMVTDSYTQINQAGIGIHMLNRGYSQLVSIFTICCQVGILCESGGQCSITNSNTSFGTFGLKADGVSNALDVGSVVSANPLTNTIVIGSLSAKPAVNDVIQFSSGSRYYTILTATPLDSGQSVVNVAENLGDINALDTATVYQRSLITASSHTFEYVGTGNALTTALPQAGGIPIEENEVIQLNGGSVFISSTDHKGDFKIGGDLTFNRATGTIQGRTFDRSIFAVLTPYILALEG
jgi:hypothetical protein